MIVPGIGPRWNQQSGPGVHGARDLQWVHDRLRYAGIVGGPGRVLRDYSGYRSVATLAATVTPVRAPWGWALDFPNSVGVKVTLSRSLGLINVAKRGLTIMALVRPTVYGASGVPTIIDLGAANVGATGPLRFYMDNLTGGGGQNHLAIEIITDADVDTSYSKSNVVTLNTWQILGWTQRRRPDTSTGGPFALQAYRDGRRVGNQLNTWREPTRPVTTDPVIGSMQDAANIFIGQFGGLWIWDYGMAPGQVSRFCSDPFGAWRFDPLRDVRPGVGGGGPPQGGGIASNYRRRRGAL